VAAAEERGGIDSGDVDALECEEKGIEVDAVGDVDREVEEEEEEEEGIPNASVAPPPEPLLENPPPNEPQPPFFPVGVVDSPASSSSESK
jgi:hypothetical protein